MIYRFFYASRKIKDRREYQFDNKTANASTSGSQNATANADKSNPDVVWNGNSITVYNRSMQAAKSENSSGETVVYRTKSAAAHDLHKLIRLDMTYADVLRRSESQSNKHHHHHHHRRRK